MKGGAGVRALDVYHLILAPTHACNLRCRHCYLPDHADRLMPLADVTRLLEQWEGIVLRDRGVRGGYFHLKGGEPLVLPYLTEVLDLLAAKATLRFMMTTNGTMLGKALLESFIRLNRATEGDAIVIVSLDGSREEVHRVLRGPNHFAQTERFARTLIDAGLNVHFNYVVHSGNLSDVPDFVAFAERVGATQVNFLPLVPKGYGETLGEAGRPDPEALHALLTRLYREGDARRRQLLAGNYAHILDRERHGVGTSCECVAGYRGLFYVTPEGDVYSCPNLLGADLCVGNFLRTPLAEIHDRGLEALYRTHLHDPELDERYLCRGERFTQPAPHGRDAGMPAPTSRLRSLPLLDSSPGRGKDYPDPIRRLQRILLREGLAARHASQDLSYCFSRNF
jgi:radical SAM protein with 4Fe4S-binding SPASM domain